MRINNGHRNLVAKIAIGLVGASGIFVLVCAEPVMGPPVAQTPSNAFDSTPWSGADDGPAAAASNAEDWNSTEANARLAQELFARDGQVLPPPTGPTESPPNQGATQAIEWSISPAMAIDTNEDMPLGRELASTFKEAVRPLYEELADSGILDAVRSLESELGLERRRSFKDPMSNDGSHNPGHGAQPGSIAWAGPGNQSETYTRPQSPARIRDDQVRARNMFEDFLEELKPWIFTLVGLYVLGWMVKLGLDYSRVRAARRRKRHALGTRHKRRRHHRRKDRHGAGEV